VEAGRPEGLSLRPSARSALVWVGIGVTVVFTYLAVRNAHLGDVWAALRDSEKVWLVPALALLAAAVLVRGVRWWSLWVPETRPPLREVLRALMIGYLFNNILPLRAGEVVRVLGLHRRTGVSRAEAAATVVVERIYDVLALLLLLFAIVPWLPEVTWLRPAAVLLGITGLAAAAGVFLLARYGVRPLRFVLRPLARMPFVSVERFEGGVRNLGEGLVGLRRPRVAVEAFLWTMLSWIVLALSTWCVLRAFDFGLSPVAGMLVVAATNLAAILPSSPAQLGVFEAAAVLALDAYGIGGSEALSCALVLHALNSLPFIAVGLILLRTSARGRR
jgi:glycosyltransferase 2 family protein